MTEKKQNMSNEFQKGPHLLDYSKALNSILQIIQGCSFSTTKQQNQLTN